MSKSKKTIENTKGVIVVCPRLHARDLEITLSWLDSRVDTMRDVITITPPTKNTSTKRDFEGLCDKVYRSKNDSILSMINKGMQYSNFKWNLFIEAGLRIRSDFLFQRLDFFAREETDILYPITPENTSFTDSRLGWFYIHQNMFHNFDDSLEGYVSKVYWCATSIERGGTFKGIAGIKVD